VSREGQDILGADQAASLPTAAGFDEGFTAILADAIADAVASIDALHFAADLPAAGREVLRAAGRGAPTPADRRAR
jgi:hypothetical protein